MFSVKDAEKCKEIRRFVEDVVSEILRAQGKHAPISSLHEGYSVILEEVDEFWDEVKKKREDRDPGNVRTELIQVAAMACRTAVDCDPLAK